MYDLNEIKLGEQLRKFRESRNISITQLGKLISKSKSSISKYESSINIPDTFTLLEICNVLNIQLDDLFVKDKSSEMNVNSSNVFNSNNLYFYYYTEGHLITSIAELSNSKISNGTDIRFFNGVKDLNRYANNYSYYYEGSLIHDKTVGYINLKNVNSQGTQYEQIQISFTIPWKDKIDKTFFFLSALSPNSIPIIKKGILSTAKMLDIHRYDDYLKVSKDELKKIKYNNAWILNDSNYDELFFKSEK